ncbi:quinolinate synthase NadA [[Clostridium] innocuum]|jgi:quinolinate synthase|nr:quinolinate synthetase complex, A subunit [Erysipelotrichaceae bacterium 3_1_53]MCR0204204.1 quinolinate synthase NadA [[Clostridium] innocuum]RJV86770.1 quinolinate synthase NadA [Erysipelotrichaceae bacterium AF19-24AC]RJV87390.1 quinolinate synthase NadA [Erysipelotrichaceae bacterium AF15-26LB]MCR0262810.1 quinolinate synthase NadA [[Clostridium] innocuum]
MTKQEEIKQLKLEKDAVLLAHYYVPAEVQEIADYVGDSFYLSKVASKLTNKVLVFCGVSFMGESGKLLNPEKAVLMPDATADCPMAHMVTKAEIDKVRAAYEDLAVVCYINSTAEIKSWSDVCVTSANAVQIVRNLPNQNILFIPDKNLGRYVAQQVPEKNVMLVKGYCPVHEEMRVQEIQALKQQHPYAEILAHPECNAQVLDMADYIGSTTGILKQAAASSAKEFIIATECGVRYELEKQSPDKRFYFPETEPVCTDMKKITLDGILHVLRTGENKASVAEEIAGPSKATLKRMLELAA